MDNDIAARALSLRLEGYSYSAIGRRIGFSRQYIQQLIAPPSEVRDLVVERANGCCQSCGSLEGRSGHVHHKGATDHDSFNDVEHLVLLCMRCHRKEHPGQAEQKQKVQHTPTEPTDIPELLERLRAKGWSDQAIGDALEVDRSNVYRWRTKGKLKEAGILVMALKLLDRRKVPDS